MADYRLRDPNKGLIGPVRLQTVRDLIQAGVVTAAVQVSRDGGPFLPISACPELLPAGASGAPRPTYSGDLGKNTFFKVLSRFHAIRATGRLAVEHGGVTKHVYIEQGQPVFLDSNIPGERFGAYLVAKGKLAQDELDVALSSMHTDVDHLGSTLLRLGLLEEEELHTELRDQQVSRLVELCTWTTGRYAFYDGARYEGDRFDLRLNAPDLILQAARRLSVAEIERRLGPQLDAAVVLKPDQSVTVEALRLSAFERRVVGAVDGRRSARAIITDLGAEGDHCRVALMVIYLLWEIDAVALHRPKMSM